MNDNNNINFGKVKGNTNIALGGKNKFTIKNIKKSKISLVFAVFFILAIAVFFLTSNSIEKKIVGTWKLEGTKNLYEFTKDGRFVYLSGSNDGMTISYTIDDEQIQFDISILWGRATVFADVSISGDSMTLSNFVDPEDIFGADEGEVRTFLRAD